MSNPDPKEEKIRFACPECETKLAAPSKHIGAKIRCPKCGSSIGVPAESNVANPAAVRARAEWSLARCPECEEVAKVRVENHGIPVSCPSCQAEMIVAGG